MLASTAIAQDAPQAIAQPLSHHGKAHRVTFTARPVTMPLEMRSDPEIASALAAIAQSGADGLAPPPHTAPDWNRLAAGTLGVSRGTTYRTAGNAETLATWGSDEGKRSARLAVTGNNLLSPTSAVLGVKAAASYVPGPYTVGLDWTGSQSGAWNGIASSQISAGNLKLGASGSFASSVTNLVGSGQVGGSVSASSAVTESLSLNGALNWSRGLTGTTDARGYTGTAQLSQPLGSDLKLVGTATVSGGVATIWAAPPQVLGNAGLQWTPSDGPAVSATVSDQLGGSYRLAMGANRSFN